jgi:putative flippase GtrA
MNATTVSSRLRLAHALLRDIRSPEWGLAGQGLRFVLSGVVVASVYATVTTVLHDAFALPFQLALVIGFTVSVCLHFTLQRLFVWRHHEKFALAVHHQMARYLCVCGSQYGVTALSTSQLPGLLGLPVEVVYLTTMLSIAGFNFVVFRGRIFHPGPGREDEQPTAQPSREAMS